MAQHTPLTPAVRKALEKLGSDLNRARRSRRLSVEDFAARTGIGTRTVARLESGDPGVGIGNVAKALHVLGELDRLTGILDVKTDPVSLIEAEDSTPKRIRKPRRGTADKPDAGGIDTPGGTAW